MACHIAGYNITQINGELKQKFIETAEFCIWHDILVEMMHKNKVTCGHKYQITITCIQVLFLSG